MSKYLKVEYAPVVQRCRRHQAHVTGLFSRPSTPGNTRAVAEPYATSSTEVSSNVVQRKSLNYELSCNAS